MDITDWKDKKRDTNLINTINNILDNIYGIGVAYYKDDAKKYPDLVDGLELIPEECPWTLEELLDESIDHLLDKLGKERKCSFALNLISYMDWGK